MQECSHRGTLRYTRRIFSNGTVHYAVQCSTCFRTIKTHRHNHKLFIKHEEIPPGAVICDWIDPDTVQVGLF